MLTTNQLLDLAKAACGAPSDYKLSQVLGCAKTAISAYRNGHRHPDDDVCRRIAEVAKLDPDVVLCSIQAERTKDENSRAHWSRIATRLMGSATTAAVVLSAAFFGCPTPADAAIASDSVAALLASLSTHWHRCVHRLNACCRAINAEHPRLFLARLAAHVL